VDAHGALDERGQLAARQPRQGAGRDDPGLPRPRGRGADTLGFFQWRQSRSGSEKFHSALVPHAGEDSDRFREVCELGAIADRLGEILGSRVDADVAVLWDYEALWAMSGPCMPSSALDYATAGHTIHRLLRDRGVTCDVVHPSADLSRYRVVVVPTLYLVSDEDAASIAAAAAAGAHVVVTYFSGISDANDHVRLGGYPGAFRDLLGVRVEEFFPLREQESVALSAAAPARSGARTPGPPTRRSSRPTRTGPSPDVRP
jgi:beta-galactosidase